MPDGSRRYGEHPDAAEFRQVPCGKCEGCHRRKVVDDTFRLYAEANVRPDSVCVTLTYNPESLPSFGSLRRADFLDFIARFRRFSGVRGMKFHAIGEYSPAPIQRPHYHASLFGIGDALSDAEHFNVSKGGRDQFTSALLDQSWRGRGLVTFQHYGPGAAAYCASHEASKRMRRAFFGIDPATRGPVRLEDEFATWSKGHGGGVGRSFYEKYGDQVRSQDFVVMSGFARVVPRYFDRLTSEVDPSGFARIQAKREQSRLEREQAQPLEYQPDRLLDVEHCKVLERERRKSQRTLR